MKRRKLRIEKPATRAIAPEHDQHEQRRGRIERQQQIQEIAERGGAELADRVGHGPESAERSGLHDDADDGEHRLRRIVDQSAQCVGSLAHPHQREAEQHREEQHLQNIADLEDLRAVTARAGLGRGDEGADDAVGDDVQDVIDRVELGGGLGVALRLLGLVGGDLRRKAGARPPQHADDDADQQSHARDEFEIDQRLQADATDALGLLDMGDAGDDGAEDDRRDRHLDQLDEGAAEEVDPRVRGYVGRQPAEQHAENDRDQHLNVENLVPRLMCRHGVSPWRGAVEFLPERSTLARPAIAFKSASRWRGPCREADQDVTRAPSGEELEALLDLGYHLKRVDKISRACAVNCRRGRTAARRAPSGAAPVTEAAEVWRASKLFGKLFQI